MALRRAKVTAAIFDLWSDKEISVDEHYSCNFCTRQSVKCTLISYFLITSNADFSLTKTYKELKIQQ